MIEFLKTWVMFVVGGIILLVIASVIFVLPFYLVSIGHLVYAGLWVFLTFTGFAALIVETME